MDSSWIILCIYLSGNVRWIAYLDFNKKLRTLGLFALIILVSITFLIANQRAETLIGEADENSDGKIDRKESRKNYLGRVFSRADEKVAGERQGDQILTRDEVVNYFKKREKGQDGQLTKDELKYADVTTV